MILIGIDPGAHSGVCVYDTATGAARVWTVRNVTGADAGIILAGADAVAIEAVHAGPFARGTVGLAESAGVWLGACAKPLRPTPSAWRKPIGMPNRRDAAKAAMIAYCTRLYGITPNDHEADAVGILLWLCLVAKQAAPSSVTVRQL